MTEIIQLHALQVSDEATSELSRFEGYKRYPGLRYELTVPVKNDVLPVLEMFSKWCHADEVTAEPQIHRQQKWYDQISLLETTW